MRDDAELLRSYIDERSEAAFAELVRRHINFVYGAAYRRTNGDGPLSEDVVQQVFSTLAQNAAALRRHTLITGWLYVATRHAAATALRSERRRKMREQEACFMEESSSPSGATVDWSRLRPELDSVIDELNDRDRDAVLLRFFAGRPFGEIGAALHISEDAARMRVERALDKLRTRLVRRGVGSTSAALAAALVNQAAVAAPSGLVTAVTGCALSSVGAAGLAGPVVAFFSIMKTSKIAIAAGLAFAATLGLSVREVYASREAEAFLLAAQHDHEAILAKLRGLREQGAAADKAAADLQTALAAERAAKIQPPTSALPRSAGTDTGEALMARHPEVREVEEQGRRARIAGNYGWLFKELNLSPAQIEEFKDLLSQGGEGFLIGLNGERLPYKFGGDSAEAKKRLQALLGEEGFRRFRGFDIGAAQVTTELAGSLFDTSTPLTPAQGEQVRRILTENRTHTQGPAPYDWPAVMAQAERVLSTPQLAFLISRRAYDEYDQAASQYRRANQPVTAPKDIPAKPIQ